MSEALRQQRRQARIRLLEPAPYRDAVRDVGEAVGIDLGKVREDRALHQLGVQLGHAVDGVARDHREVRHAHLAAIVLLDQRHPSTPFMVVRMSGRDLVE
jgi:hypothetical protein